MIVLGVDPGGREAGSHAGTGVSVVSADQGKVQVELAQRVHWNEWELSNNLNALVASYEPDVIVYESFTPRWGKAFSLDPVRLIGALCATFEPAMLVSVAPATHKSLIKRDWAKELVLAAGFPVNQGHPVDATSLCLWYGLKNQDKVILEEYKQWLHTK